MRVNYKTGLFRIWLVLSLCWLVATVWAGLARTAVVGVLLIFGIILYLVAALRRFGTRENPGQWIDIRELRQDLVSTQTGDSNIYETELVPVLDRLEAKYGNQIPLCEIEGLQKLIDEEILRIKMQRQEILDREAKRGATIEVDAVRRRLQRNTDAYAGPDHDAYVEEVDRLLESLTAKYGSRIPVNTAWDIAEKLEARTGRSTDHELDT